MIDVPGFHGFPARWLRHSGRPLGAAVAFLALASLGELACFGERAVAQNYDCAGLQAKIAELDRGGGGGHSSGPSRQQLSELGRLTTYARSLGCDRPEIAFSGGGGGRCPGLNAQILQLQTTIGVLQAGGGAANRAAARADLVAKFNAYCRSQPQAQPRQRGFFEQLFGIPSAPETQPQPGPAPYDDAPRESDEEQKPHGGSQAVCVRTCDGGFFPLSISARNADADQLTNLCQALCPNATVAVYTRVPSNQIDTAVSLDGAPYSEMPNALKFQKTFDPACTCKPPGQSWVDALAGADRVLGGERKGDIFVTPEKSVELSAPKSAPRSQVNLDGSLTPAPPPLASPGASQNQPKTQSADVTREVIGPDGVKRRVRIVGPTL